MSEAPGYNPENDHLAKANSWARDWNNRVQENQGITPDTSPIATMADGRPGVHAEAQQDAADNWRAPEPEAETETPSNVTNIAENPNYKLHQENKSVMEESGEVLATEALHPIEAARKTSEAIDTFLENPNTFQNNTIDLIKFLSTPGLDNNNKERLSSILLQELQDPNRPIDLDTINPYLDALATMKGEKSDLWQSTLRAEGERLIQAKYDHVRNIRKNAAPTVTHVPQAASLKTAAELAQEGTLTERVQKEQSTEAAQVAQPAVEVKTDNPEPAQPVEAVAVSPSADDAEAPVAPTPAEQASEASPEKDKLKAEIEAEDQKNQQLTTDIQGAWRNLPQGAQTSQALSNVPQRAGFLDLEGYKSQLEQRMQSSHLRANEQFSGLEGNEPEKVLARKQRINQEFENLLRKIENARLHSPEASKVTDEAVKIFF